MRTLLLSAALVLTLSPLAASTPPAPAASPAPPLAARRPDDIYRPMVLGGFVTAGAGLLVGTVFGAMSLARASSAREQCVESRCPPQARDDIDASKTLGLVSDAGFLVLIAGAAVGAYGLFAQSREVKPVAGVGSIGVEGSF